MLLHFPAALDVKSCFKHLTLLLCVAMQHTPLFESSKIVIVSCFSQSQDSNSTPSGMWTWLRPLADVQSDRQNGEENEVLTECESGEAGFWCFANCC